MTHFHKWTHFGLKVRVGGGKSEHMGVARRCASCGITHIKANGAPGWSKAKTEFSIVSHRQAHLDIPQEIVAKEPNLREIRSNAARVRARSYLV
jgi:hypothetical protein